MKNLITLFLIVFMSCNTINLFSQELNTDMWIPNSTVYCIANCSEYTYIGGSFAYIGPNTGRGVKLTKTSPNAEMNFPEVNGSINAAIPDGEGGWYIVGSNFTKVGNYERNRIARIKSDGSVCETFNPNANNTILTIATDGDYVYVGGDFNGENSIGGQNRNRIARLDKTNGNADPDWNPNASHRVYTIAIDGEHVYVGGSFTLASGSTIGGAHRLRIARLDKTTGNADSWNPGAAGDVLTIVTDGDHVYVGGGITNIGGVSRRRIARLDKTTGNVDDWDPDANGTVNTIATDGDNVYVGGSFTYIGGESRSRIARLNKTNGNANPDWDPDANNTVNTLAIDGEHVYVGGSFMSIGGQDRNRIARLDKTTGSIDDWDPNASNAVNTISIDGDNVYVGGIFNSIGGERRSRIARFRNSDGTLDAWNPNATGIVETIVIDEDHVYVGGRFNHATDNTIGGANRNRIARLDKTTGNADDWNPSASSTVSTIAIDGEHVYVGGQFTSIGGDSRSRIARLDKTTGNADAWNPSATGTVNTIVIDGEHVYVGGGLITPQIIPLAEQIEIALHDLIKQMEMLILLGIQMQVIQ